MVVSESSARRYAIDPDVRLMLDVRNDNAAAFEELVARYQGRLLTVLRHLVGSREWAEDLTQEVFLRVYRSRKSYEPGAKFATWLYTIANRTAWNAMRDDARRRETTIPAHSGDSQAGRPFEALLQASSSQMPARQLDKAEMREIVRMAIETLGERQRMAVLLSKFEEMGYAEIAQIMESTPQAVKSLLSRAREHLREVLQPYLEQGSSPMLELSDDKE